MQKSSVINFPKGGNEMRGRIFESVEKVREQLAGDLRVVVTQDERGLVTVYGGPTSNADDLKKLMTGAKVLGEVRKISYEVLEVGRDF